MASRVLKTFFNLNCFSFVKNKVNEMNKIQTKMFATTTTTRGKLRKENKVLIFKKKITVN